MAATPAPFTPAELLSHWRVLCDDIGLRLAGTAGEQRAADYISGQFTALGLRRVTQEPFSCTALQKAAVTLEVRDGKQWRALPANVLVGSPGTQGATLTGELTHLALPEASHRLTPDSLRGRVLMVFGSLPTDLAIHRRLLAAKPLAVIVVDERLPFTWPKNDGVFPYWAQRWGMPTSIAIAYSDAWDLVRRGLTQVRLAVTADYAQGQSQNVIGEVVGREPGAGAIVIGCHHDTQNNNVGADDNGSGVVSVLALARHFAQLPQPPRRTLRFISFGCEEQLSVGSCAYVKKHRKTLAEIAFVFNIDSVSAVLGHIAGFHTGGPELPKYLTRILGAHGVDIAPRDEVCPFSDHFCFTAFGIPAYWPYKMSTSAGRWVHHSAHDNLDNVDAKQLCHFLKAHAALLTDLAERPRLPFPSHPSPAYLTQARHFARTLYRLVP